MSLRRPGLPAGDLGDIPTTPRHLAWAGSQYERTSQRMAIAMSRHLLRRHRAGLDEDEISMLSPLAVIQPGGW